MRIGINCGHTVSGQPGCGAVGFLDESVETRNVGNALMSLFKKGGHTVVNCTDDYAKSTTDNLNKIVRLANAQPLDLFVSIHFNSGGGRGVEVYTYNGVAHKEAVDACKSISSLGFKNRGIKNGSHLSVIKHSNAKAMLVEVCFVDTDDAQKYSHIGYDKIAQTLYTAITGEEPVDINEYTEANDIIWELNHRNIISDSSLWLRKCNEDTNIYWLCRKLCQYIRTKTRVERETNEYTEIHDISWDLHHRNIISDTTLWDTYMKKDTNVYWLLRKGLNYCRTH